MIRPGLLVSVALLSSVLVPFEAAAAEGRWYAGDLHAHSRHSDGDSSVADIIGKAESVGLDYFVITDHDSSMLGQTPHWFDPEYQSDSLILLYGIEWTTGDGHANVWATAPFDYEPLWQANRAGDPWAAAESAHEQGALFSINHPTNFLCCPWDPEDGMNDSVEVWNGTHRTVTWDYGATHQFWEQALMSGRRVTAVGGSDMHYLRPPVGSIYTVGNPTTWVYAYEGTPAGILEAIAAGRTSISYGPTAPRVELWADGDLNGTFETAMGGSIPSGAGRLQVRVGDGSGKVKRLPVKQTAVFFSGELRPIDLARFGALVAPTRCGGTYLVGLYEGDQLVQSGSIACGGTWELDVEAETGSYYRIEVLGNTEVQPVLKPAYGTYVGLSNPIRVE